MSLILMLLILMWLGAVGSTLFLARDRLTFVDASWKDELLVRGMAFGAASVALGGFGLAGSIMTTTAHVLLIVAPAWVLSVLPLCFPPLHRLDGRVRVPSQTWVFLSIGGTVLGGVSMALFILIRLILSGPELV